MGRGRKAKADNSDLGWQQVFSKNVGKYLQYAIIELSKVKNHATETGQDLLKRIKEEKGRNKKEKVLPAIKASEIPYKIPENWVWCRLGEIILSIVGGGTPSKANPSYWDGNIPWASVKDLNVKYLFDTEDKISESAITSSSTNLIPKGNVIVCTRMGLGKIVINKIDTAINQDLKALFLSRFISQDFFYTFYKTLEIVGKGMTVSGIRQEELLSIPFPLPPLSEQTQIVDFLTDFENENLKADGHYFNQEVEQKVIALHEAQLKGVDLANELTHQLTLVKSLRQQLLQDAVQGKLVAQNPGDEPATVLLDKIKAEKEKLVAEKKIKKEKPLPPIKPEEIPFEIPEGWVWCRLGEVVILKRGKSKHRPRNDESLFEGGTYPFIQTGDVARSKLNGYVIETINGYYNDVGLAQSLMQKEGTLCITIAANIAECGFLGFDACTPDSIVSLTSIDKVLEKYCFYYIVQAREEIEKYAPATAQKNINLEILNSLLIPLPPLSEQTRIVQKLEALMQYCDGLEAGIRESMAHNERLLQQVLREALRG